MGPAAKLASPDPDEVLMVCDREWKVPDELDVGYAATFGRLRGLYRSRGLTAEDAADLAQEAIARALLHLRRHGCNGEPVTPLVNRIAGNLLVDHLRSPRARVVSLEDHEIDVDQAGADPGEQLARRDVTHEVRAAIAALPQRHRYAIAQSMDGRTPAEIADDLGIRRNAADALLFRARRGLAELLRAAGATLGALVFLARMRVRASGRRVADSMPVAFVTAHAGVSLMSAALATVLVCGAPATAITAAAANPVAEVRRPIAASIAQAQPIVAASDVAPRAIASKTRAKAAVDVREHRIDVSAPDGDDGVGLQLWHRRDETDPGTTGPLLDQTTTTTCSIAPAECAAALGGNQ